MSASTSQRAHRRRRLTGRNPREPHRTSTPLELLYDLTIVVAIGVAADELAHDVAEDHLTSGLVWSRSRRSRSSGRGARGSSGRWPR